MEPVQHSDLEIGKTYLLCYGHKYRGVSFITITIAEIGMFGEVTIIPHGNCNDRVTLYKEHLVYEVDSEHGCLYKRELACNTLINESNRIMDDINVSETIVSLWKDLFDKLTELNNENC